MKKLFSSVLILFCLFGISSQELPKIVPPSPEASALAEFTNVPVSHYTGIPNISVPIYTIQQKGIQIPISLSYHARGVMISEIAPRTGLGWSLQYGGSISRQVRGKADDYPTSGYLANRSVHNDYPYSEQAREMAEEREQLAGYDYYPDQFNFSAGGSSGKFVLDYKDGEPVVQSFRDVQISYTRENGNGNIDSFKIIDSNGNTYYYGISKNRQRTGQDYQTSEGMSVYHDGNQVLDPAGETHNTYSSWKLMDIETSYGEMISFEYAADSSAAYWRKSYDKHNSEGTVTNSAANMSDITKIHTRVSRVNNHEKHLTKITFNNGKGALVFTKSQNEREDVNGHALDKITFYNEGTPIKSYNLNYSYTENNDTSNMLSFFVNDSRFTKYFKRMFLSSVEEQATDGEKLPPYVFTYDTSEALPSMFSSKQDYWGYYNGAENGPFTRPFEYSGNPDPNGNGYYLSNRRVDTLKSEIGILKEIQYPTGGKAKFTYSHNKGSIPFEMMHLKKPNMNPNDIADQEIVLKKEDFLPYLSAKTITLPANTQVNYRINCSTLLTVNDTTTPNCPFYFTVAGTEVQIGQNTLNTGASNTNNGFVNIVIQVHPSNPTQYGEDFYTNRNFNFELIISYSDPDNPVFIYGAGKRIKKIEHINENGDSIIKQYEYAYPGLTANDSNATPSGAIIGLPSYLTTKVLNNGTIIYSHYNDATSAFGSFQGNSIGYSSVIEYYGTKENNIGKTEYTFTNMSDTGGDYYEFPFHPSTDNEWLRGKNVRNKIFKKQKNGDYTLVKESYNKYIYGNNEYQQDFEYTGLTSTTGFIFSPQSYEFNWDDNYLNINDYQKTSTLFRMPLGITRAIDTQDDLGPDSFGYRIYHLTGGTLNLKRTTATEYFENGTTQETITENFFDYNKHYQQKSSKVTDSKGNVIESKNYYPTDVSEIYPNFSGDLLLAQQISHIDNLKRANRFEVIQTESYKNDVLQSKLRTTYLDTNGMILPKTVQTAKGSQDLEDRIVYHVYDSEHNPVEVSKKDGSRIYYVWGYNQTQPIAKIEGYTSITTSQQTAINDAVNASLGEVNDTTENTLRDKLQDLRDSFAGTSVQVTTFTYDPMIGVTSITDPRGETIYYTYDSFNRLQFVKDADGNMLSKNEYNYKN